MRTSTRPSPARPRHARAFACLLAGLLALAGMAPDSEARTGYPRLLNIYLSNAVTAGDIEQLARWDVVALDVDFPLVNPGAIDQMRALNPDILILGYIPINGTWVQGNLQPPQTVAYRYWAGVEAGNFWLRDTNGGIVSDWPAKGTTNLTPHSPVNSEGRQYWQWFAHFVDDEVWEHGASEWDGVFLDDVWNNISWLNTIIGANIDSNRDWIADDPAQLDAWWRAATDSCTALVRTLLGPGVPVMSNGANTCYGALNGTMVENFPYNGAADQGNPYSYAWTKWMLVDSGAYFVGLDRYRPSPLKLETINVKWPGVAGDVPDTTGRFRAHVRFTLASTLLGDGYYSLDNSLEHHSSTWWVPEYDTYLGAPLGPPYTYVVDGVGLWRRDFEAASVVVNPNNATLVAQSGLPTIDGWDAYIGPPIVDLPPPDTQPPAEVDVYSGWAVNSRTAFLRWQAVGDDGKIGRAASYRIRYGVGLGAHIFEGAGWEEAAEVPNSIVPNWAGSYDTLTVTGLAPDTWYYFAVRAVDDVGNVGPLDVYNYRIHTPLVDPPTSDVIPPAAITDLEIISVDSTTAIMRWTAPGDDGTTGKATAYQGRIAKLPLTEEDWETAAAIFWLPAPTNAGTSQVATISGLRPGSTYYVGLRATDEVPNLGSLGNVPFFTTTTGSTPPPPPADTTPPAAITNLTVIAVDSTSATLQWTAPGDDGTTGTAALYRGRIAAFMLNESNWAGAPALGGLPAPLSAGSTHTFVLHGLSPSTTYFVALRAEDEVPNLAAFGNAPGFTTLAPPPPPPPPPADTTGPHAVADLAVVSSAESVLYLRFAAPADDEGTVDAYQIRYVTGTSFPESAWDTAASATSPVPASPGILQTHAVGGLSASTTYCFRMRAVDDSGNWSALSDTASGVTTAPEPPPPPPGDTEGPTTVADLVVFERGETWMRLTFTAPADAGGSVIQYELRRADGESFPEAQWESATSVPIGRPASPGLREYVRVEDLPPGTLHAFRLRSRDDAGNWSALSNTATGSTIEAPPPPPPPDTKPPGDVITLAATVTDTFNVTLTWAAPGDDGAEGQADHYDLRRRIGTLSTETWGSATPIAGAPTPALPNTLEVVVLEGLPCDTTLAFAVVAYDEAGNAGAMSNVAVARIATPPPPPDTQPPGAVESLAGGVDTPGLVSLTWAPAPEPDVAFYRLYRGRGESMSLSLYHDNLANASVNDAQVVPGRQYAYAVTAVDASGNEGPRSAIVRVRVPVDPWLDLPEGLFGIGDPWPNPAPGAVSMRVQTDSPITMTLEVFDVSGRLVCGPRAASLGAGGGELAWDGCDASGRRVPRGMYFLRVRGDAASALKRVWMLP